MPIRSTSLSWLKFEDLVQLCKGDWRVTQRDVAVAPDRDGGVRKYVRSVIVPTGGATFVAEDSTVWGHSDRDDETAVAARVAVDAVRVVPELVAELNAARDLLASMAGSLPVAERQNVEQFLAAPGVASRYDKQGTDW